MHRGLCCFSAPCRARWDPTAPPYTEHRGLSSSSWVGNLCDWGLNFVTSLKFTALQSPAHFRQGELRLAGLVSVGAANEATLPQLLSRSGEIALRLLWPQPQLPCHHPPIYLAEMNIKGSHKGEERGRRHHKRGCGGQRREEGEEKGEGPSLAGLCPPPVGRRREDSEIGEPQCPMDLRFCVYAQAPLHRFSFGFRSLQRMEQEAERRM